MEISVSHAKAQLTELIRRAEAGEEIVLTRFGRGVVRLSPLTKRKTPAERGAVIADIQASAKLKAKPGPSAARSQDYLYDESGLPG